MARGFAQLVTLQRGSEGWARSWRHEVGLRLWRPAKELQALTDATYWTSAAESQTKSLLQESSESGRHDDRSRRFRR